MWCPQVQKQEEFILPELVQVANSALGQLAVLLFERLIGVTGIVVETAGKPTASPIALHRQIIDADRGVAGYFGKLRQHHHFRP